MHHKEEYNQIMTDYIYALLDPETKEIRYIGKTDNPPERLKNHLNEQGKWHRINWLKSLKKRGLKPVMRIIEEVAEGINWEERERYWIAYYQSIGINLVNRTDGGDCGPDCTGMHLMKSPEALINLRAMLAARNRTPEMRAASRKHGLARRGTTMSPEARANISRAQIGKKWGPGREEDRKRIADIGRAVKQDPEIMRERSKNIWADPVMRAELRTKLIERNKKKLNKKRTFTNEQRQLMSEVSKKLWDDPIRGPELKKAMGERGRRRGLESNAGVKLTKEQVIEIRASNLSLIELAKKYGVSKENIRHIIKRFTWKYV